MSTTTHLSSQYYDICIRRAAGKLWIITMLYIAGRLRQKKSVETGRISVMKGSRQLLVKVVLSQLRGRGHPQNDAIPNFFADSKRSI